MNPLLFAQEVVVENEGLEPAQYAGIALVVAGIIGLLAIRFAAKMAFRTVKLIAAVAIIGAGIVFYLNGGEEEVRTRISDFQNEQGLADLDLR